MNKHDKSRRDFVKKAAYAAPAILTLQAASAMAKNGSPKPADRDPGPKTKIEPPKPPKGKR